MDESRRAIRRRVLKSATIEFDSGAYSCAVRNMSEAGAALDVPYALAIPHEFALVMETDQVSRHCRVIWRKENRSSDSATKKTPSWPGGFVSVDRQGSQTPSFARRRSEMRSVLVGFESARAICRPFGLG